MVLCIHGYKRAKEKIQRQFSHSISFTNLQSYSTERPIVSKSFIYCLIHFCLLAAEPLIFFYEGGKYELKEGENKPSQGLNLELNRFKPSLDLGTASLKWKIQPLQ